MTDTVLVTGITGFIGGHVAAELLRRGYRVRGSLRTPSRGDEVREALREAGADPSGVELIGLDLGFDDGWAGAVDGCRYVIHVASPFVTRRPKHEDELIRPAVDGTRRAVTAALQGDAERVVVTSSVAAVQQGLGGAGSFGADDWTDVDGRGVTAYAKSKTLAERAAWAVAERLGATERLAVINPGTVLGPLLSDDPGTSVGILARLMAGELPLVPDVRVPWVDVHDVAEAHVNALTSAEAAGRRTLVSGDAVSLIDIARVIRERVPEAAGRVPKHALPGWLATALTLVSPDVRENRAFLGVDRRYDKGPAERLLGHPLRPVADAAEQAARSIAQRGLA